MLVQIRKSRREEEPTWPDVEKENETFGVNRL